MVRLGTLIKQALERLLTEIWVHDLFCLRASSIEMFSRMLELNLDNLDIFALLLQPFS